jgi:hypothetical protein
LPDDVILYPKTGSGYYMRDDVLAAIAWCKKFKVPVEKALVIEEANFFHPAPDAGYLFAPIAEAYMKRIEFDKQDSKGPEQLASKLMINACYGKLAERKFRGIDPKTNEPIIPPHTCPWYASAITAHTRRELMTAALHAPKLIMQFATDAVYSQVPLALPRLKSEADIKAGKEDKLLGDWCWSKIPGAVFIQSGLAFYCDENRKVLETKSRGLPLKDLKKAQKVLDDVFEAWEEPYDREAVSSLKAKKVARHVTVKIKAFMPLSLAIASPEKYKKLHCKWGIVAKTVWLDDTGGKRDMEYETDLDFLAKDAVPTVPKENPLNELADKNRDAFLSRLRFPDWVENVVREEKRQAAAINQFHKIAGTDVKNLSSYDRFFEDDEFVPTSEIDMLLEANEDIEV